uniref:Amino acid transporter transmembrane domain-containing protein n=1 Tax=Leersia perrieri TaxID=77586 RepID=A0A0D9V2K3_9ORYZ
MAITGAQASPLASPLLHGKHEQQQNLQDSNEAVLHDVEDPQLLPHGRRILLHDRRLELILEELPQPQQRDLGHRDALRALCARAGRVAQPHPLRGFALVGAVCFYTGMLIDRCMRANDSVRSYPDIGHLAFGAHARTAIGAVMYVELYLVAVSFLIAEGDNLDKLCPGTVVDLLGYRVHGKQLFVLVAAAFILPTTWLKNLSMLAYVSAVGLVASETLTVSLVWAGVAEKGFHVRGGNLLNLSGLPTALSLYFVCFAGHGVFPTVYSSMRTKKDFPKLYTKIAVLTTLITPLAKYALVIQPVTTAIEEKLSGATTAPENKGLARAVTSTAVVVSTVVLACTVPFFGYLMSFIGSSLNVTVAVLFPCLSYLKIYMTRGVHRFEVAAIVGILVIGVGIAIVGTYTSLHQIICTF